MGWKPGKLLKKAFKGVKKITKKIGKGIKKLAFKVLGAFDKLGPIGQLALMFIGIPPVIGNFFAAIPGAIGAAGKVIGGFAQSVLPKAFTTAVKGAWGAIKTAGQGVYNTITEAIGNGLDRVTNFAKGKGFTLSEGRTSLFNRPPSVPDVTPTKAALDPGFDVDLPVEGDVLKPSGESFLEPDFKGQFDPMTGEAKIVDAGKMVDSVVGEVKPSLLDKTKDYFTEGFEGLKETFSDPKELVKETVTGGVVSGGASKIARKVAGPQPPTRVIHANIGDFFTQTNQQRLLDSTTWTGMVSDYQRAGAYGGAMHGDAASPYFAAASGMSLDVYGQLAPTTAPSNSTSSTYGTAYYPTISL